MTPRSLTPVLVAALTAGALAGCGTGTSVPADGSAATATSSAPATVTTTVTQSPSTSATSADPHAGHAMDGGPAPAGMKAARDATYRIGQKVTLSADHMPGMKGATATVVGAYDTTTYEVTYTPVDGGAPVKNHKWVVHEELDAPGTAPLAAGAPVTILADHMPGMKGAKGTVDDATDETVYIVDVTTADGMTMKNHKWVTEDEITPAN